MWFIYYIACTNLRVIYIFYRMEYKNKREKEIDKEIRNWNVQYYEKHILFVLHMQYKL